MSREQIRSAKLRGVVDGVFKWVFRALISLGTLLLAIQLYYALLPGSWFLQSQDVIVQSASAGRDAPFNWCRQPLEGTVEASAVRTFYRRDAKSNGFKPVADYRFISNIEHSGERCTPLVVKASRQPQQEGVYYFVTDLIWKQNGYEKRLRFTSNQYSLIATAQSLQERIDELELEVKSLKARLQAAIPPAAVQQQAATPSATATPLGGNTAQSQQATTSGPPEDSAASPAPEPTQQPITGVTLLDGVLHAIGL